MVQIKSSLVFLVCAALALATPVQIENDISQISTQVNALNSDINALSDTNPSLLQALTIHSTAQKLEQVLSAAATIAKSSGTPDVADGTTILDGVSAITPVIQSALTNIVAKKPAFTTLNGKVGGVLAIVQQDLKNLNSGTSAFADALVEDAPASLAANATSLKDTILSAFSTAIAAYSN